MTCPWPSVRLIAALAAPAAFSIKYCEGIFSLDYRLRFLPGTLEHDHRIAYLSMLPIMIEKPNQKNLDDMAHYAASTIYLLEIYIYAFIRLSLSTATDIAFPSARYISSISSLEMIDPRE